MNILRIVLEECYSTDRLGIRGVFAWFYNAKTRVNGGMDLVISPETFPEM